MIQQLKQVNEQNSIKAEMRAKKLDEIAKMKESTETARKIYHDLIVETLRRASLGGGDKVQDGQLGVDEVFQMDKLTEINEKKERHNKIYSQIEQTFGSHSNQQGVWKLLADKEKKAIAQENLVKAKRIELEELKKERDKLKQQRGARREYLLKEIAFCDTTIKEKQERVALKSKLIDDIEQVQREIDSVKKKCPSQQQQRDVLATSNASMESQDLDEELPPLEFKDPNNFSLLTELLRSPNARIVQPVENEQIQNVQQQSVIENQSKHVQGTSGTAKSARASRKKSLKVNDGASTSSQVAPAPLQPQRTRSQTEMPPPKEIPKKPKASSAKKAQKSSQKSQSGTPKVKVKKVTFADAFEEPNEIVAEAEPPAKKVDQKSKAQAVAKKPENIASTSKEVASKPQTKKFGPAVPEVTPKAPPKKVNSKSLIPAQSPHEIAAKSNETAPALKPKKKVSETALKPPEVVQQLEPQSSNEDQQETPRKELTSTTSDQDVDMDNEMEDNDNIFDTSAGTSAANNSGVNEDIFATGEGGGTGAGNGSFLTGNNADDGDFDATFGAAFGNDLRDPADPQERADPEFNMNDLFGIESGNAATAKEELFFM